VSDARLLLYSGYTFAVQPRKTKFDQLYPSP